MTDLTLGRVKEIRFYQVVHTSTGLEPYRVVRVFIDREGEETVGLTLFAEDHAKPIIVNEMKEIDK